MRIARQARSEKSKKLFRIFRQGASEVFILLERHCLALREEEEHKNERQEVLGHSDGGQDENAEGRTRKLSEADLPGGKEKELEEQKTKEALELAQKKHKFINWKVKRERARTLQRLESSRATRQCLFWFVFIFPGLQR